MQIMNIPGFRGINIIAFSDLWLLKPQTANLAIACGLVVLILDIYLGI
jgi:hypothetical protein